MNGRKGLPSQLPPAAGALNLWLAYSVRSRWQGPRDRHGSRGDSLTKVIHEGSPQVVGSKITCIYVCICIHTHGMATGPRRQGAFAQKPEHLDPTPLSSELCRRIYRCGGDACRRPR